MNQDNRNLELERQADRLCVEYPVPREGPEVELFQDNFNKPPQSVLVEADRMSSAWIKTDPAFVVELELWK